MDSTEFLLGTVIPFQAEDPCKLAQEVTREVIRLICALNPPRVEHHERTWSTLLYGKLLPLISCRE